MKKLSPNRVQVPLKTRFCSWSRVHKFTKWLGLWLEVKSKFKSRNVFMSILELLGERAGVKWLWLCLSLSISYSCGFSHTIMFKFDRIQTIQAHYITLNWIYNTDWLMGQLYKITNALTERQLHVEREKKNSIREKKHSFLSENQIFTFGNH